MGSVGQQWARYLPVSGKSPRRAVCRSGELTLPTQFGNSTAGNKEHAVGYQHWTDFRNERENADILNTSNDLAAMLSSVTSVQDFVSGLVFSLQLFVEFSFNFNMEIVMKTNLFTVFQAVKSECASLWGIKHRASRARDT